MFGFFHLLHKDLKYESKSRIFLCNAKRSWSYVAHLFGYAKCFFQLNFCFNISGSGYIEDNENHMKSTDESKGNFKLN